MRQDLCILLLALVLGGCGYTFRSLDPNITTVYIPPIENRITITQDYSSLDDLKKYYPNLEVSLKDRLTHRLLVEAGLKVSDSEIASDGELKVTLKDYRREPLSYTQSDEVRRWRIVIGAEVEFKVGEKTRFVRTIYGEALYDPSVTSEHEAIKKALDDLSRRISDLLLNTW